MRVAAHLLVFLVAVAAGLAAGTPGMIERAGQRIEARVERALGVDVTWGSADWSFGGTVTLTDVVVRAEGVAPGGDEPALATLDRVTVRADVGWLRARVKLRDVALDGARVHLVRRGDGSDNFRRALTGLRDLARPKPGREGGGGGGLGRFLVRHLPEVRASDLEVTLDGQGVRVPEPLHLPRVIRLEGGELVARNTALLKEDDNLTVELRFHETSLDPGQGLTVQGVLPLGGGLDAGPGPLSVRFDRPIRAVVGARVAAVGAVRWQDQALELDDVALSVPAPPEGFAADEPVDPAVSIRRVRLVPDVPSLLTAARRLAAGQGGAGEVLGALALIELHQPALVFERRPQGHNFSDLVGPGLGGAAEIPAAAVAADVGPDKALGVLMEATRAASRRLTGAATQADGDELRQALIALFARAERELDRGSRRARAVAGRLPLRKLAVRGGHFVWRDMASPTAGGLRLDERLENFDLDLARAGDLLEWKASFIVPGAGRDTNVVDGRVHLDTGDVQLHGDLGRLALHPYRHIVPEAFPVSESTALHDTDLTLVWSPSSQVARVEGRVAATDLAVYHPAVASDAMTGIDVDATFSVQLDRARKTFVLSKSQVKLGKVALTVRGDVAEYDAAPKLSGALRLERTRCQDVVDSLPLELIPMLEGLQVAGTLSWQLDFNLDTANVDGLVYNTYPELQAFKVLDLGHRLNLGAVAGTFVHRLEESDGTVREMLVGPGSPSWTSLDQVSPHVVQAVTTTEDGSFFRHSGFSPFAIRESLVTNLKKGGFVRGASTISQQLVKNLFLSRSKTISRKLQEMFITWQLESALPKERIMELYLNVIEWGPGIYGITRAADHYFAKHPAELSALESVFLVSLIPSPKRYYHQYKRGEVTDGWRRHLRWIMSVMVDRGKLSEAEFLAASPWSPRFKTAQDQPAPDLDPFAPTTTP